MTDSSKVVELVPEAPDKNIIECLEEALVIAKEGKGRSVVIVLRHSDAGMEMWRVGKSDEHIAMLERYKHHILNKG